ncbi:MAG: hypothetical protein HUK24_09500 [Sphaerochaetaceae bacterium]|nr:hypothetical protein [Sphaerochaetaceae bacterium]
MSSTRSRTKAFNIITKALAQLETKDKVLYSWPRNRVSLTHALAKHIEEEIGTLSKDEVLSVDMGPVLYKSGKIMNPDIIVHNRNIDDQFLCVVCKNDYFTEEEKNQLLELRKVSNCSLVVAVSFLSQKNYMLVYVTEEDSVSLYHFDRNYLAMEPLRSKNLIEEKESKDQLILV